MTLASKTVEVEGHRIHYLEAGEDRGGPPVLLLHGWPTNAQLYRHALPEIAANRRCIAIDLPGFGESDKPDVSYSFRFFDRVLDGFLERLGIQLVGLVVHDLGGPIGLHWAATRQERITDLVVLNTLAFPDFSWAVYLFAGASMVPGLSHLLSSGWGIERGMKFGVENKARITPEVAEIYRKPYRDSGARKALRKAAHGLHPAGFQTIADSLPNYHCPVHLIYGYADRILPDVASTMVRIQQQIPDATITVLRECGHFLQEDRPEEVATLLAAKLGALQWQE